MTVTFKRTLHDLGLLLLVPGALALTAAFVALAAGETYALPGLGLTLFLSAGLGGAAVVAFRRFRKEKAAPSKPVMALGWLLVVLLAAVPFYTVARSGAALSGTTRAFADPVNALFEAMSGMTSTGLSVASDASALPRTLQWWRSVLEWVGGIGVLFLALAIIEPDEEARAEHGSEMSTELSIESLSGETRRSVRVIWTIYVAYTLAAIGGFWAAGMPLWEAVNHGMTGIATGGFTITGDSFQSYSAAVKLVGIGVMIAGALSFAAHYTLLVRRRLGLLVRDVQNVAFGLLFVVGTVTLFLVLRGGGEVSLVDALLQWASALGTCGFASVKLSAWSPPALLLLVAAMFVGGASGSTSGGLKLRRAALLAKSLYWQLRSEAGEDQESYRFDGKTMNETEVYRRVYSAAMLLVLFVTTLAVGTLLLLLTAGERYSLTAVLFEAASALGTTGLSSGVTGPELSAGARLTLVALMWLGRLEILAVLVLIAKPQLLYREANSA